MTHDEQGGEASLDQNPERLVKWLPFPGQSFPLPDHRAWECRIVVHHLECANEDEKEQAQTRDEHPDCGVRIVQDRARKLILVLFSRPPTRQVRSLLSLRGFFHTNEGAWARTLNRRAASAADNIVRQLTRNERPHGARERD